MHALDDFITPSSVISVVMVGMLWSTFKGESRMFSTQSLRIALSYTATSPDQDYDIHQ